MDGQDGWTVDLSTWTTMEPIIAWREKAGVMDIVGMNDIMAGVIQAWPCEGDPHDPAAYRKLSPTQWAECVKRVGNATSTFFRGT